MIRVEDFQYFDAAPGALAFNGRDQVLGLLVENAYAVSDGSAVDLDFTFSQVRYLKVLSEYSLALDQSEIYEFEECASLPSLLVEAGPGDLLQSANNQSFGPVTRGYHVTSGPEQLRYFFLNSQEIALEWACIDYTATSRRRAP